VAVDPVNSAVNNFVGLFTGTNPPFAPQITELVGTNIPGQPLISVRDTFLAQMQSWFTAIPMTTQWIVLIDALPRSLTTSVIQELERTDPSRHGFDVNTSKDVTYNYITQRLFGCLFAYSATLPAEQYDVTTTSVPNNRGFLPGVLAGPRQTDAPSLTLEFRDSNTSFVDMVIRPWVILASHFGLAARPGDSPTSKDDKNVKANITIMQFTRSLANMSQIPRKVWTFYNAVPYNIGEQTLEYTEEKLSTIMTRWTYSNYTVASNLYFPIANIIQNWVDEGIPTFRGQPFNINSFQPL